MTLHGKSGVEHQLKEGHLHRPAWASPRPLSEEIDGLEQQVAYTYGYLLTGVNVKRDEDGWFVILKVEADGRKLVHFTGARYWPDVWEALLYEIKAGLVKWRPDKYG